MADCLDAVLLSPVVQDQRTLFDRYRVLDAERLNVGSTALSVSARRPGLTNAAAGLLALWVLC